MSTTPLLALIAALAAPSLPLVPAQLTVVPSDSGAPAPRTVQINENADCLFDDGGDIEGLFGCEFIPTADDGSFLILGSDGTALAIEMTSRGVGMGFDFYDNAKVALGRFDRETEDRACWGNRQTGARICAW